LPYLKDRLIQFISFTNGSSDIYLVSLILSLCV
jgi:hypothetical protein